MQNDTLLKHCNVLVGNRMSFHLTKRSLQYLDNIIEWIKWSMHQQYMFIIKKFGETCWCDYLKINLFPRGMIHESFILFVIQIGFQYFSLDQLCAMHTHRVWRFDGINVWYHTWRIYVILLWSFLACKIYR